MTTKQPPLFVRAEFDYTSTEKGDLHFKQGDEIRIVREVNDEWLEGVLGGEQGIFPISFVAVIDPPVQGRAIVSSAYSGDGLTLSHNATVDIVARPSEDQYRVRAGGKEGIVPASKLRVTTSLVPLGKAEFDFPGEQAGDLGFQAGDSIVLIEKPSADWFKGYNPRTRKTGIFPTSFVTVIVSLEEAGPHGSNDTASTSSHSSSKKKPSGFSSFTKSLSSKLHHHQSHHHSNDETTKVSTTTATTTTTASKAKAKPPPPAKSSPSTHTVAATGEATALFDYQSGVDGDLQLTEGDVVVLTRKVNDEWYEGFHPADPSKKGIMPVTFINITKAVAATPSSSTPASSSKPPPPASTKPKPATQKPHPAARKAQSMRVTSLHRDGAQGTKHSSTIHQHHHSQRLRPARNAPEPTRSAPIRPVSSRVSGSNTSSKSRLQPVDESATAQRASRLSSLSSPASSPQSSPKLSPKPVPRSSRSGSTASTISSREVTPTTAPVPEPSSTSKKPLPKPKRRHPVSAPPATLQAAPTAPDDASQSAVMAATTTIPHSTSVPVKKKPPPPAKRQTQGVPVQSDHSKPPKPMARPRFKSVSQPTKTAATPVARAPTLRKKPPPPSRDSRISTISKSSDDGSTRPPPPSKTAPVLPSPQHTPNEISVPPIRPRTRVYSMAIPDHAVNFSHEAELHSVAEEIAALESKYEELEEQEAGLESLIEVMKGSGSHSSQQIAEKEVQYEEKVREIAEIESRLHELYAKQDELEDGAGSEEHTQHTHHHEPHHGFDVAGIKESLTILNAKIKEMTDVLVLEKKQAKGAQKLADLALLEKERAGIDISEVIAEAKKHDDQVQTKELIISSLKDERFNLLDQVPANVLESDEFLSQQFQQIQAEMATEQQKTEAREKRARKREHVMNELVATEEEYCNNLRLCNDAYLSGNGLPAESGINVEKLFGNFSDVLSLSEDLAAELSAEVAKPTEDQEFGLLFCNMMPRLKDVYVDYGANFGESLSELESVMANPTKREYIDQCAPQGELGDSAASWSLNSFLIRPVQRVPRFCLLLEDLHKSTEPDHRDSDMLQHAIRLMSEVAQNINEAKRRKELVDKYKQDATRTGMRLDRMNWHSTVKKTKRLRQKLFHSGNTKEARKEYREYYKQEARFRSLEQAAKKVKSITEDYVRGIKTVYQQQAELTQEIQMIYHQRIDMVPSHVKLFCNVTGAMRDEVTKFENSVKQRIHEPMDRLLAMFKQPNHLIEKRKDKKLDYDALRRRESKTRDAEKKAMMKKEVDMAMKNFQALDDELTECLPRFSDIGKRIITRTLIGLLDVEYQFTKTALEQIDQIEFQNQKDGSIVEVCISEQRLVMMNMLGLKIIPRGIAKEFNVSSDIPVMQVPQRQRLQQTTRERTPSFSRTDHENMKLFGTRRTKRRLGTSRASSVPATTSSQAAPVAREMVLAVADYEFVAEGDKELTVLGEEKVEVLAQHDDSGNPEWWHCRNLITNKEGYVASSFLRILPPVAALAEGGPAVSDSDHLYESSPSESTDVITKEDTDAATVQDVTTVAYDFEAENVNEITCHAGDEVSVLSYTDSDGNSEWVRIQTADGRDGFIPAAFLNLSSA